MRQKKHNMRLISSICLLLALAFTITAASLAWFVNMMQPNPLEDFYASSITSYFAGGDGSATHPFLITEPIHLYNLAWLQYLGIFNQTDDDQNIEQQYYFRLEQDISAYRLIIPPIGTTEYPFVGNFDGNNKTISGVTVSNYLAVKTGDGGIEEAPASVKAYDNTIVIGNLAENGAIVGFFGVIGNWDGSIKGLAVESVDTPLAQKVNAVYNFFLNDLTVRSDNAETLMGLLAGYVTGSMENVGIGKSSLELGTDVNALNIENTIFQMQALVSEYSLIGLYDPTLVDWTDKPVGSGGSEGPGGGGDTEGPDGDGDGSDGDGAAWGGSIDMVELSRRLTYILGAYTKTTSTISPAFIDFCGYMYPSAFYTSSGAQGHMGNGTRMPLNVDTETMFAGEVNGNNNTKTTGYYQGNASTVWRCAVCGTEYIGTEFSASSMCSGLNGASHTAQALYKAEKVDALNNTGYFVGGGGTSNGYIRARVQETTKGSNYSIFRAFGESAATTQSKAFNASTFQMLTIDANGTTYLIDDDENSVNESVYKKANYTGGLTFGGVKTCSAATQDSEKWLMKYYEKDANDKEIGVKSKLMQTLTGQTLYHAVRFYNKINLASLEIDTFTATILGKTKQNYQAIKGAVNFTVSKTGYITTVAATSVHATNEHSLFSLFYVHRNADNSIDTSKTFKITTIHEKAKKDASGKVIECSYVYNLESVPSGDGYTYTLKYNEATQKRLLENNAVYYFEIPVNAGDYAIGCETTSTNGAYLMYLDIGGNGNAVSGGGQGGGQGGNQGGTGGDGEDTVPVHTISGITFVDDALFTSESRNIGDYSNVSLSVAVKNATHDPIVVAFKRASADSMTYQIGGDGAASCEVDWVAPSGVTVSPVTGLLTAQLWAMPPPTKEKYYDV